MTLQVCAGNTITGVSLDAERFEKEIKGDYNPIEKLWKNTRKEATHCKYFPTFDDLRKSVVKAFNKYMEDII